MIEALVLSRSVVLALIVCRIAGFVLTSPFPGQYVSAKARTTLVVALSLSVATFVEPPAVVPPMDLTLLPLAIVEGGIGICLGLSFRFVLLAATVLGDLAGVSMGLTVPTSFNPDQGEQSTALSRVMAIGGLLLALTAGVHRVVIEYVLVSFRALPVQSPVHLAAAAPVFMKLAGDSIEVGVRLALPVIAVTLCVQVVLAMLTRAAPSLQIFNVGFAVMIGAGILTLLVALREIAGGLLSHVWSVRGVIERVLLEISR